MNTRSRVWTFTVNNYMDYVDEKRRIDYVNELLRNWRQYNIQSIIVGKERGEQGTKHLQGYVRFNSARSFQSVKTMLPKAHIEVAKGSPQDNYKYCSKEGHFIAKGDFETRQGQRNDLECISQEICEGATLDDIMLKYPSAFIRYSKGIEMLFRHHMKHRDTPPKVYWFYGKTGVGKSKTATEMGSSYYIKDGTKWWDGYQQQEVIIIDDFDGSWPFRDLLRVLDTYQYQGQVKGGYVKINSPIIVITCDQSPQQLYSSYDKDKLDQLLRRITEIREIK